MVERIPLYRTQIQAAAATIGEDSFGVKAMGKAMRRPLGGAYFFERRSRLDDS